MSVNTAIVTIEKLLNGALDNIYINTGIKVFLGLYAAFAAPNLPPFLLQIFDSIIFRILVAFVIIFMSIREPSIAIMIAIAFVVTLHAANKYKLIQTTLSTTVPGETSWLPSAKEIALASNVNTMTNENKEDIEIMKRAEPSHNLQEQVVEPMAADPNEFQNSATSFTSQAQFLDSQDNTITNVSGKNPATFSNQHSIQGLDEISGYSDNGYSTY
jgi:hypothetical protein